MRIGVCGCGVWNLDGSVFLHSTHAQNPHVYIYAGT